MLAIVYAALIVLPVASGQSAGPPPPVRVPGFEAARRRMVEIASAIEIADAVERELVARAIALGEVEIAVVDALLGHADSTLRHLALEALARTHVARSIAARCDRDLIASALQDPHVELRVAALRVTRLDVGHGWAETLRAADDPAPEVRLATVRELASLVGPREHWSAEVWGTSEVELPARFFRQGDVAAELARRLAWTSGPSLDDMWRGMPTPELQSPWLLQRTLLTWLERQPAEWLAPGAWAPLARDHALITGSDPWEVVVTCFDECLAHRDWRRGPLAHMLRDLAATPAQSTIASALMAHVRELTEDEAATLVAGIPALCAEHGIDDAGRVLLPAAQLESPVLARALERALPDAADETRALVARCASTALGIEVLGEPEPHLATVALRAVARTQLTTDCQPLLHGDWPALLVEAARHAGHGAGAKGVLTRPLARARDDLRAVLHGDPAACAETRYWAELAIGQRLARDGRLGAALAPKDNATWSLGVAANAAAPSPVWWEADADVLAALARRAAPYEPAAAARLAEAALVAHMGLPECVPGGRSEHDARVTRTELLALWLASEATAGEQPGTADEPKATTNARMEHFARASLIAGELVAGIALANLERGMTARDPRAVDLPTVERLFGTRGPRRGADPRARLSAAVDQFALQAMLGFDSRDDVTALGLGWPRLYAGPFGRADWIDRSGAARALEERIVARYGDQAAGY
jgi:hypothetical protein